MSKFAIVEKAGVLASKLKFKAIDKAPELYFVGGVAFLFGTIALTYKKTLKFQEIMEEHNRMLEDQQEIADKVNAGIIKENYSVEAQKADRRGIYIKTAIKTAKNWAPVVLTGVTSILMFGKSFGILKGRYFSAASMAASLMAENKQLKERIKEEFGDDGVEKVTRPKTETVVDPETGEFEKVPVDKDYKTELRWPYQRFFDESNPNWTKSNENNKFWLRAREKWANKKLQERGFLFLNEVYDMLELPECEWAEGGQIYGWVYYKNPEVAEAMGADNKVSFGLLDSKTFVNGVEPSILLNFNIDPYPIVGRAGFRGRERMA